MNAAATQVRPRYDVRLVVRVSRPAAVLPPRAHMDQDRPEHQHGETAVAKAVVFKKTTRKFGKANAHW